MIPDGDDVILLEFAAAGGLQSPQKDIGIMGQFSFGKHGHPLVFFAGLAVVRQGSRRPFGGKEKFIPGADDMGRAAVNRDRAASRMIVLQKEAMVL